MGESGPNPRILIIDDQEEVRTAFSRALALDGYETHTAANADTAMHMVAAMAFDAILLDLVMPSVNGLGFLRRLRATHPHTPVAVITGKSDVDDATVREIRGLDADIRFKPVSVAQIQTVTRQLLAGPPQRPDDVGDMKEAVESARKAADAVRFAAEKARALRARKKR